ncbi:nitroreductase [Sporomusa sp.]|uniref:nitroreductase n=1 Tax=Sporomusa sp. TaxID=2078658 RepID=UPI002BFD542E|nr:nitroreductase [Sporomusa sp.]HWR43915.1 nitroreductase [Sporomusa sp.]
MVASETSHIVCKNCAYLLAKWCYQRHWWFRLVREPLLLGMRIMAWWHRIDARTHVANNRECNGCIRFMKNELEEKSPTFRFLNNSIGKRVNRLRDSMLTQQELDEAKRYAREANLLE